MEYTRPVEDNRAKPEKKIAQQVGYRDSWWPGAESNHRHKDFQHLFLLFSSAKTLINPAVRFLALYAPRRLVSIGIDWGWVA